MTNVSLHVKLTLENNPSTNYENLTQILQQQRKIY